MNTPINRFGEWPKWVDGHCELCGEYIPRGNMHRCDNLSEASERERAARLAGMRAFDARKEGE